jgi:thiol-disulfide isomerase/thioredoxin
VVVASGAFWGGTSNLLAKAPTPAQALQLKPTQQGVEYDQPSAAEVAECSINAEKSQRRTAWVVRDANNQILREFADTNGDNVVDQWSYYQNGLEVYRETDENFNGKADQCRWLNIAGTRWGIDANEDGTIDSWRTISPEEVAEEVIIAVRTNDPGRFQALLLSDKELESLGVGEDHREEMEKRLAEAAGEFRSLLGGLARQRSELEFLDFGGTKPSFVPMGSAGTTKDLVIYENTAALVGFDGKHEQISLGTLVRVGDAWRMVGAPGLPGEQAAASGLFFMPRIGEQPDPQLARFASQGPSEQEQKLLTSLEELDRRAIEGDSRQRVKVNEERIRLLEQLAEAASANDQKYLWIRQLADTISAETQAGFLPDGIERLQSLKAQLERAPAAEELIAHVQFLAMAADYSSSLQDPNADYVKIQEQWLKNLEDFVKQYPESRETADALMQLGMAEEFSGNVEQAEAWYTQIAQKFDGSEAAKKAEGALRRLGSVGKPLALRGRAVDGSTTDLSSFSGKVVLVQYWATWCEPCMADMARLREVYSQYKGQGFEIIGVNLDNDSESLVKYLRSNPLPWRQLYEPGGLESRLAAEMGIMTLPQMILVGKDGRVVNRNLHISELTGELGRVLK